MRRKDILNLPVEQMFMGEPISKYAQGAIVVVNDKGNWDKKKLTAPAEVVGNKLKLTAGNEVYEVSEPPEVVAFGAREKFKDDRMGGEFTVDAPELTESGMVEYEVTMPGGGVEKNIPQELLLKWKETLEFEEKLKQMEAQISGLVKEKRTELRKHVRDSKKIVDEIFANLPDNVSEMGKQTESAVRKAAGKIEELHKQLDEAVAALENQITVVKESAEQVAKDTQPTYHKETETEKADRQKREKEEAKRKEETAKLAASDMQKKMEEAVEAEKNRIFADKMADYNADFYDYQQRAAAAAGGRLRERPPVEPKFEDIKLSARTEQELRENAKKDYLLTLIQGNPELRADVEKLRKERAKIEPNRNLIQGNDYGPGQVDRINQELAGKVIEGWQKPYEFKEEEAPEEKGETFEFDEEMKAISAQIDALLGEIPKEADNKTPKAPYAKLHERLLKLKTEQGTGAGDIAKFLRTLEFARDSGIENRRTGQVVANKAELDYEREKSVAFFEQEIRTIENEIEETKAAEAHVEKFEAEKKLPIDLKTRTIEKILEANPGALMAAYRKMFEGDATVEFRKLVDKEPPKGIDAKELRKAGIKNWAEFKKLWDSGLAGETAKSMEEMARQTLERRVQEVMGEFLNKVRKMGNIKLEMGARAIITSLAVGGAGLALRAYTQKISELWRAVAALGGGAAIGAAKFELGKNLFGPGKWLSSEGKIKDFEKKETDAMVDELVHRAFPNFAIPKEKTLWEKTKSFIPGTRAHRDRQAVKNPDVNGFLNGKSMFAAVLAETVRDKTAGEIEVAGVKLAGTARIRFEKALAHLETKNPTQEQLKQLAELVNAMTKNGDKIQAEMAGVVKEQGQPLTPGIMDKIITAYAGNNTTLKKSMAVNGLATAALFAWGGARIAIGGTVGAYAGWKMGENLYQKSERNAAVERLARRAAKVRQLTRDYDTLAAAQKKELKDELLNLKRILHGNASPEDLMGIMYEAGGKQVVDKLAMTQLETIVYEAESTNVLHEKEEDRADLAKVLQMMKKQGEDLSVKMKEGGSKWKKYLYKIGGGALGAAIVGGGTYLLGTATRRWVAGYAKEHGLGVTPGGEKAAAAGAVGAVVAEGGGVKGGGHVVEAVGGAVEGKGAGAMPEMPGTKFHIKEMGLGSGAEVTARGPSAAAHNLESFFKEHGVKWGHKEIVSEMQRQGYVFHSDGSVDHPVMFKKVSVLDAATGKKHTVNGGKLVPWIDENGKGHFEMVDVSGNGKGVKTMAGYYHETPKTAVESFARLDDATRSGIYERLDKLPLRTMTPDDINAALKNIPQGMVERLSDQYQGNPEMMSRKITEEVAKILGAQEVKNLQAAGAPKVDLEAAKRMILTPDWNAPAGGGGGGAAPRITPYTVLEPDWGAKQRVSGAEFEMTGQAAGAKPKIWNAAELEQMKPGPAKGAEAAAGAKAPAAAEERIIGEQAAAEDLGKITPEFRHRWGEVFGRFIDHDHDKVMNGLLAKLSHQMQVRPDLNWEVDEMLHDTRPSYEHLTRLGENLAFGPESSLTPEERLFLGGRYIENADLFKEVSYVQDGKVVPDAHAVVVSGKDGSHSMRLVYGDGRVDLFSEKDEVFFDQGGKLGIR